MLLRYRCWRMGTGKGGRKLETAVGEIPVFSDFQELMELLPDDKKPNKIIIYSPPEAVYGEVKEVVQHGKDVVETIFIITEHVSIEVTAKIHHICAENNIDVIGCNTLGMINVHDHVRVGAVGGDTCEDTFKPGFSDGNFKFRQYGQHYFQLFASIRYGDLVRTFNRQGYAYSNSCQRIFDTYSKGSANQINCALC